MVEEQISSVTWEGYEHTHGEKSSDWYWILGIGTLTVGVASIVLGNTLFGVLVFVAGFVVAIVSAKPAKKINYAITTRGIRIDDIIYPYSSLETYFLDENNHDNPQLLLKSERLFMPLIVIPIPEEYINEIETLLALRLPEEHLEESAFHKFLELLGF